MGGHTNATTRRKEDELKKTEHSLLGELVMLMKKTLGWQGSPSEKGVMSPNHRNRLLGTSLLSFCITTTLRLNIVQTIQQLSHSRLWSLLNM